MFTIVTLVFVGILFTVNCTFVLVTPALSPAPRYVALTVYSPAREAVYVKLYEPSLFTITVVFVPLIVTFTCPDVINSLLTVTVPRI